MKLTLNRFAQFEYLQLGQQHEFITTMPCLLYVVGGDINLTGGGQVHPGAVGQFALFNEGVSVRLASATGRGEYACLTLMKANLCQLMQICDFQLCSCPTGWYEQDDTLTYYLKQLINLMQVNDSSKRLLMIGQAYAMINVLLVKYATTTKSDPKLGQVDQMREYIAQHYADVDLNLDQMSSRFHLSPNYLVAV